MNPYTNKFEPLTTSDFQKQIDGLDKDHCKPSKLLRPDGSEVPEHWSVFKTDEYVVIKNYTFQIKYIGETSILLEPIEPFIIGDEKTK